MKFTIPTLTVGQVMRAQIHEVHLDSSVIVSFRGDLLRVINDTRRKFKKGQWVVLRVLSTIPLRFQLQPTDRQNLMA